MYTWIAAAAVTLLFAGLALIGLLVHPSDDGLPPGDC